MTTSSRLHSLDRRSFFKRAGLAAAALTFPDVLLADPYAPAAAPRRSALRSSAPVRVRGRVHAKGRGVRGVGVSDGLSVVTTDADGRYELVTNAQQSYVTLSLPSGYQIPVHPTGTARPYQPIRANARGEMDSVFELTPLTVPDANHVFLLLADPQTQNTYETGLFHAQTVPDVRATAVALSDTPQFGVR